MCCYIIQQLKWHSSLSFWVCCLSTYLSWEEIHSQLDSLFDLSSMLPPWPMSLSYLEPDLYTKPMCMQDATVQVVYTRQSQTIWNQVLAVWLSKSSLIDNESSLCLEWFLLLTDIQILQTKFPGLLSPPLLTYSYLVSWPPPHSLKMLSLLLSAALRPHTTQFILVILVVINHFHFVSTNCSFCI